MLDLVDTWEPVFLQETGGVRLDQWEPCPAGDGMG
jgi:hypothetical protein